MMKRRPAFQEGRVPPSEDSATQKRLVSVSTEYKASLSDFLFPATSNPHSSACLPRPCNLAHLGSPLTSSHDRFPPISQPPFPRALCALSHLGRCFRFSSQKECGPLSDSIQNESIFFASFTLVVRFLLSLCSGLRQKRICMIKQASERVPTAHVGSPADGDGKDLSGARPWPASSQTRPVSMLSGSVCRILAGFVHYDVPESDFQLEPYQVEGLILKIFARICPP